MDELMKISTNGKTLIGADTNSRSTTWHDTYTNSRGKNMEDYLASTNLHIINEESERNTFHSSVGSSNIDLTMARKKLLPNICEWEINTEESLSDQNYLKYKIRTTTTKYLNQNKYRSAKYIIRDEKKQLFD
jgi:hypothetical protein